MNVHAEAERAGWLAAWAEILASLFKRRGGNMKSKHVENHPTLKQKWCITGKVVFEHILEKQRNLCFKKTWVETFFFPLFIFAF